MFAVTRRVIAPAVAVVLVAVAAVVATVRLTGSGSYRITARFAATPGLYTDNNVDILGVPTGTIASVTPHADYVDVVLSLPDGVRIPAGARAVLMAPNPVSDRFVELTPAYTGGPRLRPGAVIGLDHTVVPLELDSVYSSLDTLSKTLGPAGANDKGQVSAVLHAFARLADGNGTDLHRAITAVAAALPALTAHPDQLRRLIAGLNTLTGKLVAHNSTLNALYDDLSTVTSQLADERVTLGAAIANLQAGLSRTVDFLRANRAHIRGSVRNLDTILAAVISEQDALVKTFDVAPLGFQNFNRAIDPNAPCVTPTGAPDDCTALWGRLDLPSDVAKFVATYCGDSVLDSMVPILAQNAALGHATATHTDCGAEVGLVSKRDGAPGAPPTPDLGLDRYLGR